MAVIVMADDDETNIDLVRRILTPKGHELHAVTDGLAVLGTVEKLLPALVILDCQMPRVSGIEALRRLRRSSVAPKTPVLMLTGRVDREDISIARGAGANHYLTKPFDFAELVTIVDTLIADASLGWIGPVPVTASTPSGNRIKY